MDDEQKWATQYSQDVGKLKAEIEKLTAERDAARKALAQIKTQAARFYDAECVSLYAFESINNLVDAALGAGKE